LKNFVLFLLIGFNFLTQLLYSQQSTSSWCQFWKLSRPEKLWVVTHVLVAKKTWYYTQIAQRTTDSLQKFRLLDGDANGGQVDAFRHAYWMALLTQNIGWKKAYRLGKAHEKGNYIDFKNHKTEDGTYADKISCEMDLWNNNCGINIARFYNNISEDSLKSIVITHILTGKMKIIRKNQKGEFLDIQYKKISEESLKGKWFNQKVLDNSDLLPDNNH